MHCRSTATVPAALSVPAGQCLLLMLTYSMYTESCRSGAPYHEEYTSLHVACFGTFVQDVLDIVDLEGRREPGKYELHMGGYDLIWDGGPVMRFDKPTSLPR